jgi:hypothetical protein
VAADAEVVPTAARANDATRLMAPTAAARLTDTWFTHITSL